MIQELNKQYANFFVILLEKQSQKDNINKEFNELIHLLIDYCCADINIFSVYRLLKELESDLQLKCKSVALSSTNELIQKLQHFVKTEIEILNYKIQNPDLREALSDKKEYPVLLIWTDKKVALVELIYSIGKSINNGEASIHKIVKCFEFIFQVDLGNYYNTFDEICTRKIKPTRYLDSLINNLKEVIKLKLN
ncbi:hypothetical protein M2451_004074 [Dysgonomonas sp. PFB1-18]|uniref:RteC domain-containing protein n=1 Tax=unclassified Dysgonomonas TaxID=2630389 RepID=UPI002475D507|nr:MULTISPECIES: RteC domain-containing protein [unclassified Dysgonomonas]MDH6310887.1 hypothetical protein [Dysgonomonas sp. PF1-14]MDH6341044.1 hypothetical protein [Dysgonomonas sp. PF1-16]MDH6382727.1 hypothetical protein [Dysgonomonas sp. PFB1-18]MDH6400010.1 hypothetical protein [Dysgonomonas sp. PF1-23]